MDDQLDERIDGTGDDGRSYGSYLVIGNRIMGWESLGQDVMHWSGLKSGLARPASNSNL